MSPGATSPAASSRCTAAGSRSRPPEPERTRDGPRAISDRDAPALHLASPWFRVRRAPDRRLVRIDEPHVDPLVAANVWVVRGRDRDLVVDTGLGLAPLTDALPDILERDPIVVVTHAHLDHAGGAADFARVHAHPAEDLTRPRAASLHGPTELDLLGISDPSIRDEVADWLVTAVPRRDVDPADYSVRPPTEVVPAREGTTFDLGDRRLVVLHLPGHSPGSVVLFDEHDGSLFSGDVVYDDVLFDDLDGADPVVYRRSLDRLVDLDVRVVHPGHGDSFDRDRLAVIIERYIALRDGRDHGGGPSAVARIDTPETPA